MAQRKVSLMFGVALFMGILGTGCSGQSSPNKHESEEVSSDSEQSSTVFSEPESTDHTSEATSSSYSSGSSSRRSHSSDRSNDDEYWNSVAREKELESMGYEGAANMERNARHEYMSGGGYHSPDGKPQVHFQGSQEQAEQLRQMDEMGW
mgnify:CR=1 FL=1